MPHVRLELCFVPRQRVLLHLDEAADPGANRIHQPLALATAYRRYYGGHVILAAQLNDPRQFRQFGIHQWNQRVQVFMGGTGQGKLTQFFQMTTDAITHRQIRF